MKLQIHQSASADQVEEYLRAKLSLEAYYLTDQQEIAGDWGGKGAEMLGLKGPVTNEAFSRLLHNLHPATGEQLTDRMRKDRRPGYDMVWNVPKSVSLVYAYTKDERIIQAFREVVAEMVELAEEQAAVRVRVGDKNRDEDRVTRNLITAEHIHLTARPEDGYSDPHLHVHLYVPNLSYDPVERKWKALQFGRIHEMADDLEKVATKRMVEKLEALGFKLMPTEHAYEIEGFYRELVEKFSRRTETIEATAERLGITDPAQKGRLAALTRENKIKDVKFSDFEKIWWASLTPEEERPFKAAQAVLMRSRAMEAIVPQTPPPQTGIEPAAMKRSLGSREVSWAKERFKLQPDGGRFSMTRATRPQRVAARVVQPNEHDRKAAALALAHLLERNSVVTEMQVVAEATTNWELHKTTVPGLFQAVAEMPLMRREKNGWVFVTTPEVWAEERRIKEACRRGEGRLEPLNAHWRIEDEELNAGQRAAVEHVLHSRDFIVGIKGDPGVGKTKVLHELRRGIEAAGQRMLVLAPGSCTTHNVLRREGFENAETVAMLLRNPVLQAEYRRAVWVVDEAGQLSNRDADPLLALARRLEARVIPVGDVAQHHPVERGRAFELLERQGGMKTAHITGIQRQKGEYRRAVELVLDQRPDEALTLLDQTGRVVELPFEERCLALAKDYAAALVAGENSRVIAPTHAERRAVTEAIRAELKAKGFLKEAGRKRVTRTLAWSETERSTPSNYRPGMVVEMEAPVPGFRVHERVEVVAVREDLVRVRSLHPHERKTRPLPLHAPEAFRVSESVLEQGHQREVWRNLRWTDVQRSDVEHYRLGLKVQINAHVRGFALGEQLEVIRVSNDSVKARNTQGQHKLLPLDQPDAFSVHEKETIEIREGELIRITGNGRTVDRQRLYNGAEYKVDYIAADGTLVLENGRRLDANFKHFEYDYTRTSHAAQGSTLDRVFVAQSVELSAGASDIQQFLVSISRGSKDVKIYTDDKELLREYVSRERKPPMASELFREQASSQRLGTMQVELEAEPVLPTPVVEHVPKQERECELVMEL